MRKRQILLRTIILVILSLICMFIYNQFKNDNKPIKLIINDKNDCTGVLNLYYAGQDDINYYLYCLDGITVDYGDRKLELNKALEAKQINMDYIISNIIKNTDSNNEYTKYSNKKFSILSCNVDGNKDYYFGPIDMEYNDGFCKQEPYICPFTRTYLVLDISESNKEEYRYLTLREFQGEEVTTVKVNKKLMTGIVEDKSYEFNFGYLGNSRETNIKSIFENNLLLSIIDTEKVGLEQVNDNLCSK